MKGRMIVLDHLGRREAAALMVDGRLDDLLVEADGPVPGTIYRARLDRPMKGQGGIFAQTPDGPAFLRQIKGMRPGDSALVQVTGQAEPGKAMPVTTRLLFKSRYAIVTPDAPGLNLSRRIQDEEARGALHILAGEATLPDGAGLILRSSCDGADPDEVADDIAAMADLAAKVLADMSGPPEKLVEGDGPHVLAWRDWVAPAAIDTEPGGFDRHGVADAVAALRRPDVALSGGTSLSIEPTRALVAVDVNTGGATSPAAGLKANLAMAQELPRQLRLRGLGGQIVIDPVPMPKKDRPQLEAALRRALRADGTETSIVGWTGLGLIELQRHRARSPLHLLDPATG